jgi:hypothetical protein
MVGKLLGCNIINNSIGASRLAAGRKSFISENNPQGLTGGLGMLLSFWNTIEEKQYIICNYNNLKEKYGWSDIPAIYSGDEPHILSSSYENLLMPYLNGTYPAPDVIIIDHGFNDSYDNDNDKGSLNDTIRYTFYGACNKLIGLIREYNKDIRIVQISHYVFIKSLVEIQEEMSKRNNIYFCPLYQMDGWRNDKNPCPDGIHPHSDMSGDLNRELANCIVEYLKSTLGL